MKVLVVDDHAVVRQGLAALLTGAESEVSIVEASSAQEALSAIEQHPDIDIAVVDLIIPGGGIALIAEMSRRKSELPVIVLSASEELRDVQIVMQSGAMGYVTKSANPTTLLSAIRMVLGGDMYLPPLLLNHSAEPKSGGPLTPRQREILQYLESGDANKVIAAKMRISEKTVKAHLSAVYRDLDVSNRTQAVEKARQMGLIENQVSPAEK